MLDMAATLRTPSFTCSCLEKLTTGDIQVSKTQIAYCQKMFIIQFSFFSQTQAVIRMTQAKWRSYPLRICNLLEGSWDCLLWLLKIMTQYREALSAQDDEQRQRRGTPCVRRLPRLGLHLATKSRTLKAASNGLIVPRGTKRLASHTGKWHSIGHK